MFVLLVRGRCVCVCLWSRVVVRGTRVLRKGVLLERTYIHSRRLPLGLPAARDPMSRETPTSLAPPSPTHAPWPAYCTPRTRRRAGAPPAGGPRRRPCGAPASGASRAPETTQSTTRGRYTRRRSPSRPRVARPSAASFHLCPECPLTCFNQNPTPLCRLRAAVASHSARAVATSFLFLLPFQTPEPQSAAYRLSNLTRIGLEALAGSRA